MILDQLDQSNFSALSTEKEEGSDHDVLTIPNRAMTATHSTPIKQKKPSVILAMAAAKSGISISSILRK